MSRSGHIPVGLRPSSPARRSGTSRLVQHLGRHRPQGEEPDREEEHVLEAQILAEHRRGEAAGEQHRHAHEQRVGAQPPQGERLEGHEQEDAERREADQAGVGEQLEEDVVRLHALSSRSRGRGR